MTISKNGSFFLVGLLTGFLLAIGGVAFYLANQTAPSGHVRVLKLAHGLDATHPVHLGLVFMAERVQEKSGGTVEVQIFPGGVLGSETDNIEQVQRGALAMTKVSAAALESFVPEMALFGLPHLFNDADHFWRVLQSPLGQELLTLGTSQGLRGLCYYDAGARSFYMTDKPILTPDDLQGEKIRVMQTHTAMDMVKIMGGSPTPISWGELYTSLQQGIVDGAENNPPSFYTSHHYEVCKYFSLNEHTRIPDMLVISEVTWNALPLEVQHWIKEAAEESTLYQRKLWQEGTEVALAAVQKEGVKLFYPDTKPFQAKVQPLLDAYQGTPIGALIRRIRETP